MGTIGNKVRSDDTDDAVPEPVGCSGETNTTRTDGEREDLANDDPGSGTPSGSEDGNVQANEGNHSPGGVWVGWVGFGVLAGGGTNDTDDELHDNHTGGTEDQDGTTSDLLNHDERGRRGEHVHEGGDERDQEGVLDRTKLLEEDGAEVEDEVDTGKLLHHLHANTKDSAADVGGRASDLALEASHPRAEVAGLRNNGHFVLVVGNDLSKLVLNVFGVERLATDTAKRCGSLVELALLDPVTGRLRKQSKTSTEDESPQELHSDRDTVGTSVASVLGGVDDAVGKQDTDGDAELITSNNGTTNLLRSDFRHITRQISQCTAAICGVRLTE